MKPIHLITTGGTIDAEPYHDTPAHVTPLAQSIIPTQLAEMGLAEHCEFTHLPPKDSKKRDADDIAQLATLTQQSPQRLIIITYGTDVMAEHASQFKAQMPETDKMVLFTGAMKPLMNQRTGIGQSDGADNLAFACAQHFAPQPGTFIAFHQKLYNPDVTKKDFENLCFTTQ